MHTKNKFFSGGITKFFQGGKTNFDVFPEVELRKFKHLKRDHSVSKSLKKSDFTTQNYLLLNLGCFELLKREAKISQPTYVTLLSTVLSNFSEKLI